MPRWEETREKKTFTERIDALINYARSFKQMWPFYWLKAAAVRDPHASTWRLCYFALVGRWGDAQPIQEICDIGNAILAVSQLIDANKAWEILASLQRVGTAALLPGITVLAKPSPDVTFPTSYWQADIPLEMPRVVAEVAESADWRYLYLYENSTHLRNGVAWPDPDNEKYAVKDRVRRATEYDLDERSERNFESFASTRLGLDHSRPGLICSIEDFLYHFDFPLALRIEPGIPDRSANKLPLTIYCRRPLKLETLKVSIGNIWLPNAEYFSIENVISVEDGWSVGDVTVPYTCGKIWFASENLAKALPYDIPIPTPEDQITEVLGSMYHLNSLDEGKRRWKQHLLESTGTDFEIALLNAIARFGIPVLFAGQLQAEGQTGGTATPGHDLVALNHTEQKAVLISAKGSPRVPTDDDCKKLLDRVELLGETLPDWHVTGIIACHAPDNRLGRFQERTDLRVWSREDLEQLYQADKRESIESLLWPPPNLPGSTDWGFLDSH